MGRHKSNEPGKKTVSISFDMEVYHELDRKARMDGKSLSSIVNMFVRQNIMSARDYYQALAKFHAMKMYEAQLLRDEAERREGGK